MKSGINILQQFEFPKGRNFTEFLGYINNKEKQQSNHQDYKFENYNNYMYDDRKTNSLFSNTNNKLTQEDIKIIKKEFNKAQENNSFMWKTVISFDNEYLRQNNVLNGNVINEELLKNTARNAMNKMLVKERIHDYIYSGAIHSNTDNIHIHLAIVEKGTPTRKPFNKKGEKVNKEGRFKISTFEIGKSTINKNLNKNYEPMKEIDRIIRNVILEKEIQYPNNFSRKEQKLVNELLNELPTNKNMWQYNNKKIKHLQPKIKELSKVYLENNFKKELEELNLVLDKQQELYSKTYGEGKEDKNNYKENKINDMYSRVGNKILNELKSIENEYVSKEKIKTNVTRSNIKKLHINYKLNSSIKKLNRNIKEFLNNEKYKNQLEYEKLERQIEMQHKGYEYEV